MSDTKDPKTPSAVARASSASTITRDGATVELDAAAFSVVRGWLRDCDEQMVEQKSSAGQMADRLKGLEDQISKLSGERDALRSELDKMKADAECAGAAPSEEKIGDAVTARLALLRRADELTFGSKVDFGDCKTDRAIRLKVIKTRLPDLKVADDAADGYLAGLLDGLRAPGDSRPADRLKKNLRDGAAADVSVADARQSYIDGMRGAADQKL